MRNTALVTSVMILVSVEMMVGLSAQTTRVSGDFRERDEFNQTYQLAPGARVGVSSIRGPVEIFNTDTATAEVQIIRTARTRADLDYHKVEVEQTPHGLVVRGVQEPEDRRRQNIQVNHHVILKVPRRIDLAVSSVSGSLHVADADGPTKVFSISGSVTVGNVGGPLSVNSVSGNLEVGNVGAEVRANSISGSVRVRQVDGFLELSSVSGSVKATVNKLETQGIQIRSVSGSVEIGLKGEVNAEFTADDFSGEVYLDVPGVLRHSETTSSRVRARIGTGGSPITISSVSGNIRLTRS